MRLSKDFEVSEFTRSATAMAQNIKNEPGNIELGNLLDLVNEVLQPLRDKLGVAVKINSGYRSEALNRAIGGVNSSQHSKGEAADITAGDMSPKELFDFIRENIGQFDQLIEEPGWVHVSYARGRNRKQLLKAVRVGKGKMSYTGVK
jgi:hypothetical protein